MTKPHIKELKCFQQVADVIGEVKAQQELWKVVHSGEDFNRKGVLLNSFNWVHSPQGWTFWCNINQGVNPYSKAL